MPTIGGAEQDVASIAILDVGKTNVRLVAADGAGRVAKTLARSNGVLPGPPYPHFDVDGLIEWVLAGLSEFASEFAIDVIVPVTHGACAALIGKAGLVLPILDYEYPAPEEVDDYEEDARRFDETGSPRLPFGLNLGRQLAWLEREFPDDFSSAEVLLPYPSYWAWRLCGVRAYEVTSLGCHTDLWCPDKDAPSKLVRHRHWDRLFPERRRSWDRIGLVSEKIRKATGLRASCSVLAGVHDSNASYLAHRSYRDDPFCVVSTGTWVVAMAHGGSIEGLCEDRDTLANVDVYADPTPTARFMGGREYAAIAGPDGLETEPTEMALRSVLDSGVLARPSFSETGGPFAELAGTIMGSRPTDPVDRAALAALYCALVTDVCLELIGARGEVVVEGRFAKNRIYCEILAALRGAGQSEDEGRLLSRSLDETGTIAGAALLARLPERGLAPRLERVTAICCEEICVHRARWRTALERSLKAGSSLP